MKYVYFRFFLIGLIFGLLLPGAVIAFEIYTGKTSLEGFDMVQWMAKSPANVGMLLSPVIVSILSVILGRVCLKYLRKQNNLTENPEFGILDISSSNAVETSRNTSDAVHAEEKFVNNGIAKLKAIIANMDSKDSYHFTQTVLDQIATHIEAKHGIFYGLYSEQGSEVLSAMAFFAVYSFEERRKTFAKGVDLIGQCWKSGKRIHIKNTPSEYVKVLSGLGEAPATNVIIQPVNTPELFLGAIELAAFKPFSAATLTFLDQAKALIAEALMQEAGYQADGYFTWSHSHAS